MKTSLRLALGVMLACLVGCGGDDSATIGPQDDAGPSHESGSEGSTGGGSHDGAAVDGGEPDATIPADANAPDTSVADTSVADTSVADTSVADTSVADTSVADTSVADTSVADTSVADTSVHDATSVPDTSVPDVNVPDTSLPDAGLDATIPDAGLPDAQSGVDASADAGTSHVCSNVRFTGQSLTADGTFDIVVPDCALVHGVVSLPTLPSGAAYGTGVVSAFSFSGDGGINTDGQGYSADIVQAGPSAFSYAMAVPVGTTYSMMYQLEITFGPNGGGPLLARLAYEQLAVAGDLKHDVVLADFAPITAAKATVSAGTNSFTTPSGTAGYGVEVAMLNAAKTTLALGIFVGAQQLGKADVQLDLPGETLTPYVSVIDIANPVSPGGAGFLSTARVADVAPSPAFTLTLPALAKMSGTVSDPNGVLTPPMRLPGGAGQNLIESDMHCDGTDFGTFPNPPFVLIETGSGFIWSDVPTYKTFLHSGVACIPYPHFAIQLGPGGRSTVLAENTFGYLQAPAASPANVITPTADFTKNYTVPALGAQITVRGKISDAHGNPLPGANLQVESPALTNIAGAMLDANVLVDSTGHYTLHTLPGTSYKVTAFRPAPGVVAPPPVDAGAPPSDAGAADAGGSCGVLGACCPTLPVAYQAGCTGVASSGNVSSCSSELQVLQSQGYCK